MESKDLSYMLEHECTHTHTLCMSHANTNRTSWPNWPSFSAREASNGFIVCCLHSKSTPLPPLLYRLPAAVTTTLPPDFISLQTQVQVVSWPENEVSQWRVSLKHPPATSLAPAFIRGLPPQKAGAAVEEERSLCEEERECFTCRQISDHRVC